MLKHGFVLDRSLRIPNVGFKEYMESIADSESGEYETKLGEGLYGSFEYIRREPKTEGGYRYFFDETVALAKADPDLDAEPEEKLEPGDINPDTGEEVPEEPEEEDEEDEEDNNEKDEEE